MKRLVACAAVAAGLTVGLVAPAAAEGATALAGPCGSSYTLVGHHSQGNDVTDEINMFMDVYYSSTAKRNCLVVQHANGAYGVAMYTHAAIRPSGSAWPPCNSTGCDESETYKYYAGPVYTPSGVDMSHRCVDISGLVGINTHKNLYGIHCG